MELQDSDRMLVERREADFLNFLIDIGIANPTRVSRADLVAIQEFLERNEEELVLFGEKDASGMKHDIPNKNLEKLGTLLGSEAEQEESEIESCLDVARMVIKVLKEKTGFPITGAIVSGSRMDKGKMPRFDSDLDIHLFVNTRELVVGSDSQLDRWQEIVDQMDLPFPVSVNGALCRNRRLWPDYKFVDEKCVPIWAWNVRSIRFVGTLTVAGVDYVDDAATKYLVDWASAPAVEIIRKERIRELEERIGRLIA